MMERRRFLRAMLGGGIAATVAGCASMVAVPVRVSEGRIRIPLSEHPELTEPGGHLKLRTDDQEGRLLYLLALDDGEFAALSPICTHQGCTVDVQSRHLVCPCHGSTYTRDGSVVQGPAEEPLRRFPVRPGSGNVLVIETEAP